MKKTLSLLLALLMLLALAACGDKPATPSVDDPVNDPANTPVVDPVNTPVVDPVVDPVNTPVDDPADEVEEQQILLDFGAYAVGLEDAELTVDDYEYDCLMLTLAYINIDPEETGRLGENIKYTATQNGEELSLSSFSKSYWENEPDFVWEGEVVHFHIGFRLKLEYNQVYYDMSGIEVVLQDKNSDLFYSFTVDPSALDDSGLKTGGGKGTGETAGFGDFESIFVPANFEFRLDTWKENNPHYVSIANCDWIYFNFRNYTDEEYMRENYEYLKENYTEEQIDVSANYGGIDWTGFQYYGYGGYNFEVYTVIGGNYLRVSSAGFTFDDVITQAVLGSVVMADGSGAPAEGGDGTSSGDLPATGTEVGGETVSTEWLDYWVGDWYGWWMMSDGTGLYTQWNDGTGEGVWDACARIEVYEDMTGCMVLWDNGGSCDNPVARIDVCFANPDDTELGVMSCNGGLFIGDTLEEGAWYIDPDEFKYDNIIDFVGEYEDEDGTFFYRVMLRPWGIVWDDMSAGLYPEQYYYDWYLPLVEAGASMPDSFN